MTDALNLLQYAVSAGFVGISILILVDWLRYRERSRGYLALAIGLLGITSLLVRLKAILPSSFMFPITAFTIVTLMGSGYMLLLFRDTFVPLTRRIRIGALAAVVGATALEVVAIGVSGPKPRTLETVATLILVTVWAGCVLEPIARLWAASRGKPAVQRARLRALSAGYAGLVIALLIAGIGGSAASTPLVQLVTQAMALLVVPLLYASFAPPGWLRRIWRDTEEGKFRGAIQDLLLFSPDRATLANRGAEWAKRLVGADGVAVIEANGDLLAIQGMHGDEVRELAAHADAKGQPTLMAVAGSGRPNAIVIRLPLDTGPGALVVRSGPFTPFFGSDEMIRLWYYATNMTAALDRARMTERMAALEKTKSQFLNLASHELRSPLGVINGYLSMLEQGSLGQLKDPGLRAIEVLKAKALEMNMLVAQMLDAARLEDGRLALKRDRLDLRQIARVAIEGIKPLVTTRHRLVLDNASDPVPIIGDEDRLVTIITNLLENAVKYSPEGGTIQCTVLQDGGSGVIKVRDEGVGIAEEDLPRLFNRFERIRNRETSHVGGTGLGLYLSRELGRQHGGDVLVDSRPGKGSTFTLTVPVANQRPEADREDIPSPEPKPAAAETPRLRIVPGGDTDLTA
ncbi:MAG: HAMP domain-containing histidine kinase [Candidatus Dormibacteraeota bacterium]|nr:HAMP domain-containing histidine kinase [Candidatus Dormibacteraeota bacterium]